LSDVTVSNQVIDKTREETFPWPTYSVALDDTSSYFVAIYFRIIKSGAYGLFKSKHNIISFCVKFVPL
jgi:hypothetical protein